METIEIKVNAVRYPKEDVDRKNRAAWCYGCHGDWRKLIYWLSAAVLTASVTF